MAVVEEMAMAVVEEMARAVVEVAVVVDR
jgi:hypothetical protein